MYLVKVFVSFASFFKVIDRFLDLVIQFIVFLSFKLDFLELLNGTIQVIINRYQLQDKNLKMVTFKNLSNLSYVFKISSFVLFQQFAMNRTIPSHCPCTFHADRHRVISWIFEAVVYLFKFLFVCIQRCAGFSLEFRSVAWVNLLLLREHSLLLLI